MPAKSPLNNELGSEWLFRFLAIEDASLTERREFGLEACRRFIELSDDLEVPVKDRLQFLGRLGQRTYTRWKFQRDHDEPFLIYQRLPLLCAVLDAMEIIAKPKDESKEVSTASERLRKALPGRDLWSKSPVAVMRLGDYEKTFQLRNRLIEQRLKA